MNDLAAQRHEEEREEWLRLEKRDLLLAVLTYLVELRGAVSGLDQCVQFINFMLELRFEDVLKE